MQFFSKSALLAGSLCLFSGTLTSAAAQSQATYQGYATSTANTLISKFHSDSNGQFNDLWWNSAVTYTGLADLAALLGTNTVAGNNMEDLWSNVYDKHINNPNDNPHFLNPYYDDEGWWVLAWIAAYDLTNDAKYLQLAADILFDIKGGQTKCGAGIWWSKDKNVLTVIENVLFMSGAAHLATRVPQNATLYTGWATDSWNWISNSALYDSSTFMLKGNLNPNSCDTQGEDDNTTPSSYQQGVLLGGLLELNKATNGSSSSKYIQIAKSVAHATITSSDFVSDGVFHEPLGGFDNDTAQFKGIFMRNLAIMNRQYPDPSYSAIITTSATSIWQNARNSDGTIIALWQGNPSGKDLGPYHPEVSTSAAFSCLVAAAEVEKSQVQIQGIKVDRRAIAWKA